ncbi:hypothetical protein FNV43_RR03915 [Rhamnella rubrinervis]|uniref:Ataxin 2 SM domain-containing protein n=1 Tax=Rhamnella rubrinervis TaxID=2594499 RepID=A0A8K0HJC7_9ROSA|nr:hypothetical protein FNV43_RR03915 [Rhamnella rubrinervis]
MGCRNRELHDDLSASSSLSGALLFTTMCIIGLPVDVHVKDGSVYSGIFHTACVENDYGIVLKKARMTKKGRRNANITNVGLIDTLVILSGDLVQVVAKRVLLPADGIAGNVTGNDPEATVGTVSSDESPENYPKKSIKSAVGTRRVNGIRNSMQNGNGFAHVFMPTNPNKDHEGRKVSLNNAGNSLEVEHGEKNRINLAEVKQASGAADNGRQCQYGGSQGEQNGFREKLVLHKEESADKCQGSSSSLDTCLTQIKSVGENHTKIESKLLPSGVTCDVAPVSVRMNNEHSSADTSFLAVSSGVLISSNPAVDVTSESCNSLVVTSTEMVPSHSSEPSRTAKEFKLNPGAKIFSPSFTNTISATSAVPTVASMGYIPSNSPAVPVAAGQPEVGMSPFASHSPLPVKVVPYGNFTAGNGCTGSQFSQPVVGHVGSRTQPLRYAGQYPLQTGPAYVQPSSQAVMVGRLGQLLYMHPVSQEVVQGVTAISPLSARPIMTPQQVPFPKHQGIGAGQALQRCVPPPFVAASGQQQQPFGMPCHIPVLQPPFPNNRPIQAPGSNGLFGSKFS